ncbi:MAG: vWA domain-containing protein [Phycisphaerales bacterium]
MTAPTLDPVVFAPPVGMGLIIMAVLVLAVLAFIRLPQRWAPWLLTLMRVAAIVGIAVLLANPSSISRDPSGDTLPRLTVLLDASGSMSLEDAVHDADACSRLDALRHGWLTQSRLTQLAEYAEVRLFTFDDRIRALSAAAVGDVEADGDATRIARCVATLVDAISERSDAGDRPVLILTDGVDTDGRDYEQIAPLARASDAPISAVVAGADQRPPDVIVSAAPESPLIYEGQDASIEVRLRQTGFDHHPVRLTVRRDGPEGEVLHRETTLLGGSGESRRMDIAVTPDRVGEDGAGPEVLAYYIATEPLDGESDIENNGRHVFMQVASERIKVLVFEGSPYWDTKFLISALRSDPQIELTSVLGLGRERHAGRVIPRVQVTRSVAGVEPSAEETIAPPTSERDLFAYDVVVLGRRIDAFFPGDEAERLVRFVTERGGSLLLLRGPAVDPDHDPVAAAHLDLVSPVTWGAETLAGGRLVRTDAGRLEPSLNFDRLGASDAVITELPEMRAVTRVEAEKALSVVWMRAGGDEPADPAALAHMNVGRGRSMAVMTDGLWRWALLPPSLAEYEDVYGLFWARTMRWLALGGDFLPGQSVSLTLDDVTVEPGEPVVVRVRTKFVDADIFRPELRVVDPDGATHTLNLTSRSTNSNEYRAAFTPLLEGPHEVILDTPGMTPDRLSTRFGVYDTRIEYLETASRTEDLERLADQSGGRLYAPDEFDAFIADLDSRRAAAAAEGVLQPVWMRPWLFAVVAGLLAIEWIGRRRIGLA